MNQNHQSRPVNLNRRAALGSAAAIAATFGIGELSQTVAAQEAGSAPGPHAIVGAWLVVAPPVAFGTVTFAADGIVTQGFMPNYVDPALGVTFQGIGQGTWEAVDERQIHFTAIRTLTNSEGMLTGTYLIEGWPSVSEDGQAFDDHDLNGRLVIRDAAHLITMEVVDFDPGVMGIRITPGSLTMPGDIPAATPVP